MERQYITQAEETLAMIGSLMHPGASLADIFPARESSFLSLSRIIASRYASKIYPTLGSRVACFKSYGWTEQDRIHSDPPIPTRQGRNGELPLGYSDFC
jgi:hypothetical protein